MDIDRDQFLKVIDQTFESISKLTQGKGYEYQGESGWSNVHSNFDRMSSELQLTPEKVLLVYLKKHMDSITTWANRIAKPDTPAPEGLRMAEPMEGRFDDAILYLILLKAMHYRRTGGKVTNPYGSMHAAHGSIAATPPYEPEESVEQIIEKERASGRWVNGRSY